MHYGPSLNTWLGHTCKDDSIDPRLQGYADAQARFPIAVATFLLLSLSIIANAQELAATLTGRVTDPSGATISGATVTIVQNGVNGSPRTLQTDAHGSYTATNLAAGNYTVTVTAAGFQTYTAQNVILNVAQTRSVDAPLTLGAPPRR